MTEAVKSLSAEEALQQIHSHVTAYLSGGPDLEADDIALAQQMGLDLQAVMGRWAEAREYLLFIYPPVQPKVEAPKLVEPQKLSEPEGAKVADEGWGRGKRRGWGGEEDEIGPSASITVADEDEAPTQPKEATQEPISLTKREELFKAVIADKVLTTTQPVAFQHSKSPAGIPASLENAITAITKLDIDCRYDVFHDRIMVKGHECGVNCDVLENLENVTLKVRQTVLTRFGFDPSATFTFDALKLRCLDRVFDPVRDYLDTLRWDARHGLMIGSSSIAALPTLRSIGQ